MVVKITLFSTLPPRKLPSQILLNKNSWKILRKRVTHLSGLTSKLSSAILRASIVEYSSFAFKMNKKILKSYSLTIVQVTKKTLQNKSNTLWWKEIGHQVAPSKVAVSATVSPTAIKVPQNNPLHLYPSKCSQSRTSWVLRVATSHQSNFHQLNKLQRQNRRYNYWVRTVFQLRAGTRKSNLKAMS